MLFVRGYCYHCKTTTTLEVTRQGTENAIEGECCFCHQPFAGALVPADPQENAPHAKTIKVF
jgi:hypothetical protein